MTYAYVKIGLTLDDILAISSEKTNDKLQFTCN